MAAMAAGLMTRKFAQPYKNPHNGPYAARRYGSCPPASGYAALSSAMDNAPNSETTPPRTQASTMAPDPVTSAATVAGTMKIADAIIVPTLIMTASRRPSSRLRSVTGAAVDVMRRQRWRALYGGANQSAASVYKSRRQPVGDRTARETSSRINPSTKLAPTPTPMRGLASESCSRGPARPTSVNTTTRAAGRRFASSSRARQNASPLDALPP